MLYHRSFWRKRGVHSLNIFITTFRLCQEGHVSILVPIFN